MPTKWTPDHSGRLRAHHPEAVPERPRWGWPVAVALMFAFGFAWGWLY